ncbi:hypothetical protein FHS04_000357 [Mesoflavibacter sabulilitoris]|jgi:hypothetical protein|nr:hypothetical protein [Mesoflavibacter zeaxanthinifaciens]MBB3122869.1 hypothetical protein [Mesoflavibacter zeaxanthinifaciens subsp. sabulilitoris]
MAKLYSKKPKSDFKLNPKDETISFILNYSKALSVINYKSMKFESLQN